MDATAPGDDLRTQYTHALPYLRALPINEQRLDLSILDRVQPHLAQRLLERLLHPAQDVSVHIPLGIQNNTLPNQISQLKALQRTFEHFSNQAEQWSIGFPLLIWKDEALDQHISAPLFLWRVQVVEALGTQGDWIIRPSAGNQGYLNPMLKSYLETRLELNWTQDLGLFDEVDGLVIKEITLQLEEHLGAAPLAQLEVTPCPDLAQIPDVAWSGSLVLGHFEPLTAKDNRKLPKDLQAKHRQSWVTKIPALPCTAEQAQILEAAFQGHHCAIVGPTQSGKTHTMAAALPSLLADQGTALVVLPDADALAAFQRQLETLGLGKLGILTLSDPVKDKERLITYLERLPKHSRQLPAFDDAHYSEPFHAHQSVRHTLTEAHRALQEPLLDESRWIDLLGEALQHHDRHHRQLLGHFLTEETFYFTTEEYHLVAEELAAHYPFFAPLDALKHPLNALHGRFFAQDQPLDDTLSTLPSLVHQYRHKVQRLYERYLILLGHYAEHLQLESRDWVARLEQQMDKMEEDLARYNRIYGDDFDKQSSFQDAKLRVLSLFSSRYQAIRAAKAQLLREGERLQKDYEKPGYLKTPFPDLKGEPRLADVTAKLAQVRQNLHDWAEGMPERVDQKRRSVESGHPLPAPFDQQNQQLNTDLKALLDQLNADQLLRTIVPDPAARLTDRVTALLQLILQFQKLEQQWDDLSAYYRWRQSWRHLSARTQRVVQGLVQAGAKDWSSAFRSWYFHQRLLRHYQPALPRYADQTPLPYADLLRYQQQLRPQIVAKASRGIKEGQAEQIKRIKREKDLALNKVRRIFQNKQLKDILEWIGLEHLGDIFPIVLTTTELADYFLPAKVPLVDWIILEEAHHLPQDLGTQLLQLGNQQLVLGDPDAATLSDHTLQWMLDQQGRQHFQLSTPLPTAITEEEAGVAVDGSDYVPAPTPFHHWLQERLQPYLEADRLTLLPQLEVGLVVDCVIHPRRSGQQPFAVWLDGGLLHHAALDFERAVAQTQRLEALGYVVLYEWSVEWWQHPEAALERFLARVLDQEETA